MDEFVMTHKVTDAPIPEHLIPKIDKYPKDRLDAFTKYVKDHRSHEDHNLLLNWLMYWRKHLRGEEAEAE